MRNLPLEAIERNEKIIFPYRKSNKSLLVGKLRYWWCWFVAAILLLFVAAPAMVFLWIINRRSWLYPICFWGADVWLKACGAKIKVKGLENLEADKSYVFISNHRSYLDTVVLFRYAGKRIGLVAKRELLKVPVLGQGMNFVNIIAIDRTNPERALKSMEKARAVLNKNFSFGVFAEGTRAMPGELLPFKKGAFHLAIQTDASIVPVAIKNTDSMMGKRTGVLFPGTIKLILLAPIETVDLDAEKNLKDLLIKVRGAIAEELAK